MNNKKGFTLVEIMIVVVIIGLLAAMAIPAFQRVRVRSIRSTMENDARQLSSAANQYFMDNGVTTINTSTLVGSDPTQFIPALGTGISVVGSGDLVAGNNFQLHHDELGDVTYQVDTGRP
ncbi:MAG: prepilin-type N-terminal cleavage/methylation domain-containing protein [Opitutales bacterium]|nr:prepilin-type N-terminal cleavage/methylation domain-containing protein [Opitutales bacterium]